MKQLTCLKFVEMIAKDFELNPKKETVLQMPSDKLARKRFVRGVAHEVRIFDGKQEHPYMIGCEKRNEEAFSKAVELRYLAWKNIEEILGESGAQVKITKCKICEGGGWFTEGKRYIYKNFYMEH